MQRLIRSFNTLTDDLRDKLQEQYPDGIDNSHIRTIATAKGDSLRVIELRTPDAIYLIKISAESREEIEQFLDQDEASTPGEDIEGTDDLEGADDAEEEEEKDDVDVDDDDEEDGDEPSDGGDDDDED
ncbi:MAG TPA: DNA primase [Flavobacteriales bacterium]